MVLLSTAMLMGAGALAQEPAGSLEDPYPGLVLAAERVPVQASVERDAGGALAVLVNSCEVDRDAYFRNPSATPMMRDRFKAQQCQTTLQTAPLADLVAAMGSDGEVYAQPAGFVYHMGRCGSTLVANMLASSPKHIVYSEPHATSDVLLGCRRVNCTPQELAFTLKDVIMLMGRTSVTGPSHLFIKFQSSMVMGGGLDALSRAFPDTPWLGVVRDPLPVIQSFLKDGARHASCVRSRLNPPPQVLRALGDIGPIEALRLPAETYCAGHLAGLMETLVHAATALSAPRGRLLLYDNIISELPGLIQTHFGVPLSGVEQYSLWTAARQYSKGRSEAREFEGDAEEKAQLATPEMKESATAVAGKAYERAREQALQDRPVVANRNLEHLKGLDVVVDAEAPAFMSSRTASEPFEPFSCPDEPLEDYPREWPILDLIHNWNPDNASYVPPNHYLSICRFDYQDPQDLAKAFAYRDAEKPFIVFNAPQLTAAAQRWQDPLYLDKATGAKTFRTEVSADNHFMYYKAGKAKPSRVIVPENWEAPTDLQYKTYREWLYKALTDDDEGRGEHWYLSMFDKDTALIREDVSILDAAAAVRAPNLFFADATKSKGINCRFGMHGVVAEAHFDGSRNMVAMVSGRRRWILSHPRSCRGMYLLPLDHPSGRHSEVEWGAPDLDRFPDFRGVTGNEVILRAGEVLYVPTYWFHFIVNLGVNVQCNARSGKTGAYLSAVRDCGFNVKPPPPA